MSDDNTDRVESLFQEAFDLPEPERADFLARKCGANQALRAQVETLLGHDNASPDGFLEGPTTRHWNLQDRMKDAASGVDGLHGIGEQFGRYRVKRLIGYGGMGAVYEAEQDNPRRRVALKVLRFGMAMPDLVKRFQREAHLLAHVHHPSIAHIYEAGVADSPSGPQPFFAMEYIDGCPLDQWARDGDRSIAERLELMAQVCDAVHHAHERGVIHRDLKPGNIMVDASKHPTILDFGIARATQADIQTVTVQTEVGQLIGTIPYMSPEQVLGISDNIDARSDVYALGVIIYELLAGKLPLDVRECSIPEAARIIREEDPSRLSSINPAFGGDIETIVAKALEKDCDRRYQSAAELAGDIRRFFSDEPIIARPASTFYQLRKFAKRNKRLVAVVAIAFAGLAVATVVSTRFGLGEAAQRRIADRERAVAHRSAYLTSLVAARMALQSTDAISARRILEEVPPEYRESWEWKHLYSLLDSSDAALIGHTAPVTDVDFSPDGATLISASRDHTLRLWNVEPGSLIRELTGHDGAVVDVEFSPDGSRIASASADGSIRIWNAHTGAELLECRPEKGTPRQLTFSSDGYRLASTHSDFRFRIWDAETGTMLVASNIKSSKGTAFHAVQFFRDGAELLVGGSHGLWRFDADTGTKLSDHFSQMRGRLQSISVSPSTNRLVTCGRHKALVLWDATTLTPVQHLLDHTSEVTSVAFDSRGRIVASSSMDQSVRLWNTETGMVIAALMGHKAAVNSVAFSPDDAWLASASDDHAIRLWRTDRKDVGTSSRVLRGHTYYVYDVAFDPADPAGTRVVSVAWDDTMRLWDAGTAEPIWSRDGVANNPDCLTFNPDGSLIASTGSWGEPWGVHLWDANTGEFVRGLASRLGTKVHSLAFSSDGTHLAAAARRHTWRLGYAAVWHVASGDQVASYDSPLAHLVANSPDGLRIAEFERGGARIIEAISGRLLVEFDAHEERVNSLAYSPDGALFLTASDDGTVAVWDSTTGEQIARLRGHTDKVYDAAYSPDGTRIASCSNDNTIRLWDAETFEEVLDLRGHERYVHALSFSPDGSMIASASGDHTLRIWDSVSRMERATELRRRGLTGKDSAQPRTR